MGKRRGKERKRKMERRGEGVGGRGKRKGVGKRRGRKRERKTQRRGEGWEGEVGVGNIAMYDSKYCSCAYIHTPCGGCGNLTHISLVM